MWTTHLRMFALAAQNSSFSYCNDWMSKPCFLFEVRIIRFKMLTYSTNLKGIQSLVQTVWMTNFIISKRKENVHIFFKKTVYLHKLILFFWFLPLLAKSWCDQPCKEFFKIIRQLFIADFIGLNKNINESSFTDDVKRGIVWLRCHYSLKHYCLSVNNCFFYPKKINVNFIFKNVIFSDRMKQ